MPTLAITRRPIVFEAPVGRSVLAEMLSRLQGIAGRASLYGIDDPLVADLWSRDSIEADFQQGYYRNGPVEPAVVSGLPSWTFSRSGQGTSRNLAGQVAAFATGAPRLNNRGLRIDETRTNYNPNSADFATGWGVGSGVTVTSNVVVAPDGTMTGDKIEDASAVASGDISRVVIGMGAICTHSVWLRSDAPCQARIAIRNDKGVVASTVCDVTTAWQRFSVTSEGGAGSVSEAIWIYPRHVASETGYVYAWGDQAETWAYPSSYIPTTSAAATRGRDTARLGFAPTGDFSAYVEAEVEGNAASEILMSVGSDNASDRVVIFLGFGSLFVQVTSGGVIAQTSIPDKGGARIIRAAVSVREQETIVSVDGAPVVTIAGSRPVGISRVWTGMISDVDEYHLCGWVRRVMLFKHPLSSDVLQRMTT